MWDERAVLKYPQDRGNASLILTAVNSFYPILAVLKELHDCVMLTSRASANTLIVSTNVRKTLSLRLMRQLDYCLTCPIGMINDGDYLLLEHITPSRAGAITGSVIAIERQDETGEGSQYLLRTVLKGPDGGYILRASNAEYRDMDATDGMRTLARLKAVLDPLDMALGRSFIREEIPELFGETYNVGNWNVGHVALPGKDTHVLLVTINKQGKAKDHRYLDHWIDERTFHWQSQNSTKPESKRGQDIIWHEKRGIAIQLFVRETKLENGKGAPFVYCGAVRYKSHTGSGPMSVIFELAM